MSRDLLQNPRGSRDLFGTTYVLYNMITQKASQICQLRGYAGISTPILEYVDVFAKSLGETSDVVGKEMYHFHTKGGSHVCLRPEGTAGVMRAALNQAWHQDLPKRLYYHGPMFRYEAPQKGRYRQFHQFGVECLGIAKSWGDIEVIALAYHLLQSLGFNHIKLHLNSLGDDESRKAYREALLAYLNPFQSKLSSDSQERLIKNPLRILDSKDLQDREILQDAPSMRDYLNPYSTDFFQEVCSGLDALKIPYILDDRLVRGLDYYCHTAFEFICDDLGSQSTVLAGGRYDKLSTTMGGPLIPSVGWAMGIDRLMLLLQDQLPRSLSLSLGLIVLDQSQQNLGLHIQELMVRRNVPVQFIPKSNLGKALKTADKLALSHVLILGGDEAVRSVVLCRNLQSGVQIEIPFSELNSWNFE